MFNSRPMRNPQDFLTIDEANEVISHTEGRDKLLLLTLLHTGRRISEVVRGSKKLGIRIMDINIPARTIDFMLLKRRYKHRTPIPIDNTLATAITKYVQIGYWHPEYFLFPFTERTARNICYRAGLKSETKKHIHPHIFRHTLAVYAVQALKNPADLVKLQKLLGHGSIETTMWYLEHFAKSHMGELVQELWEK